MGPLIEPLAGVIYLDSNCFIYSVEKIEPYCRLLEPVWQAADEGRVEISTSELTLLETLAKPLKTGDELIEGLFRELLIESGNVALHSISRPIIEAAALLRAHSGLRTPDAIHAATALSIPARLILTNDPAFKRIDNEGVTILSELV